LRRQLRDRDGNVRGILLPGEQKAIQTDRVVLVPGPDEERAVVREIFNVFNTTRSNPTAIARLLNSRGLVTSRGNKWTRKSVGKVLINEKYAGTNIYNRVSKKFKGKSITNPPGMWIRCRGAYEAIVPSSDLDKAKRKLQTNSCAGKSKEALLDELRDLLQRKGRLGRTTINEDIHTSCVATYVKRFGSLYHAYNQIGYLSSHRQTYHDTTIQGKRLHRDLCNEFEVRCEELGATVERRPGTNVFVVDRHLSVLVAISHCRLSINGAGGLHYCCASECQQFEHHGLLRTAVPRIARPSTPASSRPIRSIRLLSV
jgi:hypothetical protein